MPVINGIGRSQNTETKHEHFRYLMMTQMRLTQAIWAKSERRRNREYSPKIYLHFDITAGDGGTPSNPGSTRIMVSEARNQHVPYHAVFIEKDNEHVKDLEVAFIGNKHVTVIHGDHNNVLRPFIDNPIYDAQSQYVYGSVFADPNGIDVPWQLLGDFSQVYKRIDLIIYLSATAYKRVRCVHGLPFLNEQISKLNKRHLIVREAQDFQQWTILLATNWDAYPEYRNAGFVNASSARGQVILRKLIYTTNEREQMSQMGLPFPDDQ